MGISGLLPALKPIHRTKHLSEFKGQTIAVDAYVWLHKGVFSCATELATGKPTQKYVDYAMYRVRLLRHFGIEPYIVFDGGPLPAKRGTEVERKQRREENRARGKALTAQGKHSQARECYVKCIDVTPQMAYQFIKALRAENVQYIVAPYEADAQMAYLERTGVVNAILTEDSDLLVFGCSNVLFKFEPKTGEVCHISRHDFGSVTSTAIDYSAINLHGWNDEQFRAMAILSGCDYLPSIPGIGLKTANALLRKWKTAERVVKAIMMEGKKNVPTGYWENFMLAESCFRFQRVYDPLQERLVHLTQVEGQLDEAVNAYVGEDMPPDLAKRIAMGDADPITCQSMKDINPKFTPQATQRARSSPHKGKGKAVTGDILSFFGPKPVTPREKPTVVKSATKKTNTTGTASGKRTLGGVMDQDLANRKQLPSQRPSSLQSKFFIRSTPTRATSKHYSEEPVAGPSRLHNGGDDKENIYIIVDDDDDDDDNDGAISTLSVKAITSPTQDVDFDFEEQSVEQEDGYMSPFSVYSDQATDIPSPTAWMFSPLKKKKRRSDARGDGCGEDTEVEDGDGYEAYTLRNIPGGRRQDEDFDVDPISSPVSLVKRRKSYPPRPNRPYEGRLNTPTRSISMGSILVVDTPQQKSKRQERGGVCVPLMYKGPDLQSCLGEEDEGDLDHQAELVIGSVSRVDVGLCHEANGVPAGVNVDKVMTSGGGGGAGVTTLPGSQSKSGSGSVSRLSPSPHTTAAGEISHATFSVVVGQRERRTVIDVDAFEEAGDEMEFIDMEDPVEEAVKMHEARVRNVAQGWRMKWALGQMKEDSGSSTPSSSAGKNMDEMKKRRQSAPTGVMNRLKRSETNVTPLGKHSLVTGVKRPEQIEQQLLAWSAPPKPKPKFTETGPVAKRVKKRSSLVLFMEDVGPMAATKKGKKSRTPRRESAKHMFRTEQANEDGISDVEDTMNEGAQTRLNRFRWV